MKNKKDFILAYAWLFFLLVSVVVEFYPGILAVIPMLLHVWRFHDAD